MGVQARDTLAGDRAAHASVVVSALATGTYSAGSGIMGHSSHFSSSKLNGF
jgi:hypothetical protein